MVIWIGIGTSLLKPPSPLSALIFHLLSFVSCLTSPWKLQVRRVLGLGLGFYILFIHYYRVICRSSDHTMGSPLADIRTRDGLSRSRDTKPHKPPHFPEIFSLEVRGGVFALAKRKLVRAAFSFAEYFLQTSSTSYPRGKFFCNKT